MGIEETLISWQCFIACATKKRRENTLQAERKRVDSIDQNEN